MERKTAFWFYLIGMIPFIVSLILTAYWHERKIFLIMFLFVFANNLMLAGNAWKEKAKEKDIETAKTLLEFYKSLIKP